MPFFVWIFIAAGILLFSGFLYQTIGAWFGRRRFAKAAGFLILGDGARLFVRRQGSGRPTVVFEAGIGASSLNWRHIQQAVARIASTISYDRAGLGWSSSRRSARTPSVVAAELHQMLERAGVQPPLVLVGHSFGGLVVRRYALLYPAEVASIVLVDPMRCEEYPPFNPGMIANLTLGARLCACAVPIARFGLARLGLGSLICGSGKVAEKLSSIAGENCRYVLRRIHAEVAKMPAESRPELVALWSRPSFYAEMRASLQAIPEMVTEMRYASPIQDIPVLVLTPGRATPLDEEALRRIGNRAQQVIAHQSRHWIHFDEPDLVIRSILEMVHAAAPENIPPRREAAQSEPTPPLAGPVQKTSLSSRTQ
jgi:pimeloyl-ACP methyl ester carboxylesterase